MGTCNLPLLLTILVVSMVGYAVIVEAQTATSASNLVPFTNSCYSIKEAMATQLECLCGLYTNPSFPSFLNITVQQAVDLSRTCSVNVKGLHATCPCHINRSCHVTSRATSALDSPDPDARLDHSTRAATRFPAIAFVVRPKSSPSPSAISFQIYQI